MRVGSGNADWAGKEQQVPPALLKKPEPKWDWYANVMRHIIQLVEPHAALQQPRSWAVYVAFH